MGIYKLLGASRREPLRASYQDIKKIKQAAVTWRRRIRVLIQEQRDLTDVMADDRHLISRHLVVLERSMKEEEIRLAWDIYRKIQSHAQIFKTSYIERATRNREKMGRRRSA